MDGNNTPQDPSKDPQPFQPGATIRPGLSSDSAPVEAAPVAGAAPSPPLSSAPVTPVSDASTAQSAPDDNTAPAASVPPLQPVESLPISPSFDQQIDDESVYTDAVAQSKRWTASEFIAHAKSKNWYVVLFGAAIIVAAIVWLLTKDVVSAAVVVLAVGVLAGYASRQPRQLEYSVDEHGITIGPKHYAYNLFRSFSVIDEDAFSSIELMPQKRFMPAISIYYAPEDEDEIMSILAAYLPFEQRKRDPIDQLMHRIRF